MWICGGASLNKKELSFGNVCKIVPTSSWLGGVF